MPQPDSGNNCCDCPSRSGPCDGCGGGGGACCIGNSCSVLSADDCAAAHGYYNGDGSDCDPDPCGVTGACCFPAQILCPGVDDIDCGVGDGQACLDSALPGDCTFAGGHFLGFFPITCAMHSSDCNPIPPGSFCCPAETPDCCGDNEHGWACCTDIQTCCIDIDGFPSCCDAGQTCTPVGCI